MNNIFNDRLCTICGNVLPPNRRKICSNECISKRLHIYSKNRYWFNRNLEIFMRTTFNDEKFVDHGNGFYAINDPNEDYIVNINSIRNKLVKVDSASACRALACEPTRKLLRLEFEDFLPTNEIELLDNTIKMLYRMEFKKNICTTPKHVIIGMAFYVAYKNLSQDASALIAGVTPVTIRSHLHKIGFPMYFVQSNFEEVRNKIFKDYKKLTLTSETLLRKAEKDGNVYEGKKGFKNTARKCKYKRVKHTKIRVHEIVESRFNKNVSLFMNLAFNLYEPIDESSNDKVPIEREIDHIIDKEREYQSLIEYYENNLEPFLSIEENEAFVDVFCIFHNSKIVTTKSIMLGSAFYMIYANLSARQSAIITRETKESIRRYLRTIGFPTLMENVKYIKENIYRRYKQISISDFINSLLNVNI